MADEQPQPSLEKKEENILEQTVDTNIEKPKKESKSSNKTLKSVITIIIILIILVAAGFLVNKYTSVNLFGEDGLVMGSNDSTFTATDGEYKAVFLSNGQVYFGKLISSNDEKTIIEDIYYLQVQDALQPASSEEAAATTQSSQQLSLVKLGNELHGPKDYMEINTAHVLFVEELKANSKVVEAIVNYKNSNADQPTL